MYHQPTGTGAGYSRGGRRKRTASASRSDRKERQGRKERILLVQLALCLVLFLTVFVGKGVFPHKLVQLRENIGSMITQDFDFRQAMAELGESLAGGDGVFSDLGEFCVQVFGAGEQEQQVQPVDFQPPEADAVLTAELNFLSEQPDAAERTEHYSSLSRLGITLKEKAEMAEEEEETTDGAYQGAIMAAGTVYLKSDYNGPALPNNYTMDVLSLGGLETMTPIMGHMNSPYGYRTNPVTGDQGDFHGGVDIGGQMGDPIAAFASGTVEYIGQDDSYGIYLQIDHGNGIKSFYAHCSQLLVSKGDPVTIGQTVALVGATGTATGPHLHLELKYGKTHMNPAYYVEFLNDQ